MAGLTYLSVDPILKVVCMLRCFYGESLTSGEDLRAELKRIRRPAGTVIAAIVVTLMLGWTLSARAAEDRSGTASPPAASAEPRSAVSPQQLDQSIGEVIQERKYTWRMPRETTQVKPEKSAISRFIEDVLRTVRDWIRTVWRWVDELLRKLFRREPRFDGGGLGSGWAAGLNAAFYILIAAALAALGYLIYRMWRGRQPSLAVAAQPVQPAPDLADENVGADQLPVDGWTRLARELLDRGEFRLALRAFYLASLAHLADRNMIQIARFKSNRDYQNELNRRAHGFPDVLQVFGGNVLVFERIWYGMHAATREMVEQFASGIERMKGAA
jgi:hypothetical protein